MSRILYRARDPRGGDIADFVEAGSAAEAMKVLAGMGLKDIVLLQSPDIAAFNQPIAGLTSRQQARLRTRFMDKPGWVSGLRNVARLNARILLPGAIVLAIAIARHDLALAAAAIALLLVPFGLFVWKRRDLDRYHCLQKAYARGQWGEVRRLAALLRAAKHNALLPWDIDVRLACIQAREGQLDAAIGSLEAWKPKLATKAPGMYESRLAGVHAAARDYDGAVRLMEEALVLSGHDPSRKIDAALAQAKYGDADRARELLESADAKLVPPLALTFMVFTRGILALRGGQAEQARIDLQEATEGFFAMSWKTPAAWVGVALSSGYYAVALARCGQRALAQRAIVDTWPILLVHGEQPLMDMLHDEVLPEVA